MDRYFSKIYNAVTNLPRNYKSYLLFCLDTTLVPLCLYAAFALRLDTFTPYVAHPGFWQLHLLLTLAKVVVILTTGQHKVRLHNFGMQSVYKIGVNSFLMLLSIIILLYFFKYWAPRSVPIIFFMLFFFSAVGFRVLLSRLLNRLKEHVNNAKPVAIYGTGTAAMQILSALRESEKYKPVFFFDDNSAMHHAILGEIRVENPINLREIITKMKIQEVFIAVPEASEAELKKIVNGLSVYEIKIHIVPTIMQLLVSSSRDIMQMNITPDDLLQRDKELLTSLKISAEFNGKIIVVTGAGGSVGSELSRQLMDFQPKKLVLLDSSEFALYSIDSELSAKAAKQGTELVSRLGSILDGEYLEHILSDEGAQILFHAAAYKHVPLVEQNILEAVRNNVLGTYNAAAAAGKASLQQFILISTDKAVRPSNIMGATKRLAELVSHSCSQLYPNTNYAVVRFGNVLGSSGSVIPLFKKQLSQGGPITVTDPGVTRYFMTIPEAAKLVLVAGLMSKGGDTFVLDMGEPVKIVDLARRMISLAGHSYKNPGDPNGDIAIEFIGLRRGEKMYEELFFDKAELSDTPHKKIYRLEEKIISTASMQHIIEQVNLALLHRDEDKFIDLANNYVDGFTWNSAKSI